MASASHPGTRILVIGGNGHVGSEVCRELSADGCTVAFTYHSGTARAETLAVQLAKDRRQAPRLSLDLEEIDQVSHTITAAADALGGLDGLVIASGLSTGQPWTGHQPEFSEVTAAGFDRMMAVNVRGVFFACQAAVQIMRAAGGGRIVIVGSVDGVKPVPSPPDYACTKAALWGLTQSLSKELGSARILVNLVAPGIVDGGIATYLAEDLMKDYLRHSALRRTGTASEIARVVAFLVGPRNTYLTGQAVVLDGGL